jgi:hypothetical protein
MDGESPGESSDQVKRLLPSTLPRASQHQQAHQPCDIALTRRSPAIGDVIHANPAAVRVLLAGVEVVQTDGDVCAQGMVRFQEKTPAAPENS